MKYNAINKILEFMEEENYDYVKNQAFIDNLEKDSYTMEDHISALVFSLLSANRRWGPIDENQENIKKIFHNFDPEYLKNVNPEKLVDEIKEIKCGNRNINKQMSGLKDNIRMFEKIEKEWGSLDNFVNKNDAKTIAEKLAEGEYKLTNVRIPLACQYLKGVGIDCAKPDKHLHRILARLGYSIKEDFDIIDIIKEIYEEYEHEFKQKEIDTILWQYCAKDGLNICGKEPKCDICKIKCDYSKNIKEMDLWK